MLFLLNVRAAQDAMSGLGRQWHSSFSDSRCLFLFVLPASRNRCGEAGKQNRLPDARDSSVPDFCEPGVSGK